MNDKNCKLSKVGEKQKESILKILSNEQITNANIDIEGDDAKGNNYLGEMIRIKITGENEYKEPVTKHLLVKSAPAYEAIRKKIPVAQFYSMEVYTYNCILPALLALQSAHNLPDDEQFVPIKCYETNLSEGNEHLVMDNMNAQGFQMCSRKKALEIDHMRLIMKQIAYFHSLSFALKAHKPELFEKISKMIDSNVMYSANVKMFYQMSSSHAAEYIDDPLKRERMQNCTKELYDKVYYCIQSKTCEPYNVICHGDFWPNNIIFRSEKGVPTELRFVDWQMVKCCSPIVDLSHVIFSGTEESVRKNHYQELLDLYYDTLSVTLQRLDCDVNICYPRHIFEEHLKTIVQYGFALTIISLSFLMREESDVLDVEAIMNETMLNEAACPEELVVNFRFKNQTSIDDFKVRINGVINDFMKLGVL